MPFWTQLGSILLPKNSPTSLQKSILTGIDFLIVFCIDFFSILAPSWDPGWGHVGHIFAHYGGRGLWHPRLFVVGSMLFFDLGALLTPPGATWAQFLRGWASILEVFGAHLLCFNQLLRRAGGVTRSVNNEFVYLPRTYKSI